MINCLYPSTLGTTSKLIDAECTPRRVVIISEGIAEPKSQKALNVAVAIAMS